MGYWKLINHKWRGFAALPLRDQWLMCRAVLLLAFLSAALKLISLQRVQSFLAAPPAAKDDQSLARAQHIASLVEKGARNMILRPTCLPRSLTLWHLLRRYGIDSTIRLGARKTATGQFEAHAWVEYHDVVLNDRADIAEVFAAFPTKNASL